MQKEIEKIIPPVNVEDVLSELDGNFFRPVNKGDWELYDIVSDDAPNVMREIGRLREITFRAEGGGTGKNCDIDDFDKLFNQLILWDPEAKQIVGGYRYAEMKNLIRGSEIHSPTGKIFEFSPKFLDEYLPHTIELGRSFVIPSYQLKINRKGIFSLDNLWDGLGGLTVKYPHIKYLFGKITMYPSFNVTARTLILMFLRKHYQDKEVFMHPIYPLKDLEEETKKLEKEVELLATMMESNSEKDNFDALIKAVKTFKEFVPPLIKQYFDLAPTTKYFGTSISPGFGDVEESGVMVTIADIRPEKKDRHIESYKKYLAEL